MLPGVQLDPPGRILLAS